MGFPILGDPQYGTPESLDLSAELGLGSQMLCAKALELIHPVTGAPLTLESEMDVVPLPGLTAGVLGNPAAQWEKIDADSGYFPESAS